MKKATYISLIISAIVLQLYPLAEAQNDPDGESDSNQKIIVERWAIGLEAGVNPDKMAESLGAENIGQIGYLENTYLFQFPASGLQKRSASDKLIFTNKKRIRWVEQQKARWRFARAVSDPLFSSQWYLENTGQYNGIAGNDIGVVSAWNRGYTGEGIVIGMIDDGIEYTHPDLSPNYRADLSYDFNDNDPDPMPFWENKHGTAMAGIAAARDNQVCGRGAAFRAGLAGIRLIAAPITDADEAMAISYQRDRIHIYVNSWGGLDDGTHLESPGPLTQAVIEENVKNGRNGLGSIYIWSAGNGRRSLDNVNYDGYANSMFVIAVSATDHKGVQTDYSEPGAAILINAPADGDGAGIATTDLKGSSGYSTGDCAEVFGGTSSAAAMTAGVVALMLQANPELTWRDVQHILIKSAIKNDPLNSDWVSNGAGLMVHHAYGFGRVNADKAVTKAFAWQTSPPLINLSSKPVTVNRAIPDNNPSGINSELMVEQDIRLEHVEVVFSAAHICRGDLNVVLTSPSGTKSILAEPHNDRHSDYTNWKLMTVRCWDESSKGKWTLSVSDRVSGDIGMLQSWTLILHGTRIPSSENQPPMAYDDHVNTSQELSKKIAVTANDMDVEGDPLTITAVSPPGYGTAAINTDNTITYTPASGYIGNDEFVYTISDGEKTAQARVSVSVGETCTAYISDDTPKPIPDGDGTTGVSSTVFIPSGGIVKDIRVMVNITHPYVHDLTGWIVSPSGAKIALFNHSGGSNSNFTNTIFDDAASQSLTEGKSPFSGSFRPVESFTRLRGEQTAGKWTLQVVDDSVEDKGTLNFWKLELCSEPIAENMAPIVENDNASTDANVPKLIDVLGNDFDPNGDALTLSHVSTPAHGSALVNANKVLYTPQSNFTGEDTFTYTVSDGTLTSIGTVIVYVGPKQGTFSSQHSSLPIPDWNTTGITSTLSVPVYGKILDVNVRVNITHDWFQDLNVWLISPAGIKIPMLAHVSGASGKSVGIVLDDESSQSIANGLMPFVLSYRPLSPLSVLDGQPVHGDWKLIVSDDRGEDQGTLDSWQLQVFWLPFSETQSPSVVADISETAQNTPIAIDVLANDYDMKGYSLSVSAVSRPAHGTAVINSNQTVTYTPAADFIGKDTFTYTVTNGLASVQGTVTVMVGRIVFSQPNALAIPDNDSIGMVSTLFVPSFGTILDINVRLNITHPHDKDLNAYLISPSGTRVALFESVGKDGDNFINCILDDEAYPHISDGTAPFTGSFRPLSPLSVLDGEEFSGEWKLQITDTIGFDKGMLNSWALDAAYSPSSEYRIPAARSDHAVVSFSVQPSPTMIDVMANDNAVDGNSLSIIGITAPLHGIASISSPRTLTYTPVPCFYGQDSFMYTIQDSTGGTNSAQVVVNVDGNALKDGGFESGTETNAWIQSSVCQSNGLLLNSESAAHSGKWAVRFESCNVKESAYVEQKIMIPKAGKVVLKFWLRMVDSNVEGYLKLKIDDTEVFSVTQADIRSYLKWVEISKDVSAFADGESHSIRFENVFKPLTDQIGKTTMLLDDISLNIERCLSRELNLQDAVVVMKLLTGISAGNPEPVTDVSADKRVGTEELIDILQKTAGIRN